MKKFSITNLVTGQEFIIQDGRTEIGTLQPEWGRPEWTEVLLDDTEVVHPDEFEIVETDVTSEVTLQNVQNAIAKAKNFGDRLLIEFAAENVLLGITQANMTNTVRKNMSEVISALATGSLLDAIYEARQIPAEKKDATFITDARLLSAINKIEAFLGMSLSEEL